MRLGLHRAASSLETSSSEFTSTDSSASALLMWPAISPVAPLGACNFQRRAVERQGMQRLAQVVAGRSEEARLGTVGRYQFFGALGDLVLEAGVGLSQPCRHAIELHRESFQLVAAAYLDALVERAGARCAPHSP